MPFSYLLLSLSPLLAARIHRDAFLPSICATLHAYQH
jgi:hypothetical protein